MSYGEKIKQARIAKGLSQEEVAEEVGISVRTLQRIENENNEVRYATRKKLEALMTFSTAEKKEQSSLNFLQLLNFSSLAYLILPLANLLLPGIIYKLRKDRYVGTVIREAKKLLLAQLVWSVLAYGLIGSYVLIKLMHWESPLHVKTAALLFVALMASNFLILAIQHFRLSKIKDQLM